MKRSPRGHRRAPERAWPGSVGWGFALLVSSVLWWAYSQVRWPSGLLGWIVWVPFFVCVQNSRSWRQAAALCVIFPACFVAVTFPWFAGAVAEYVGLPWLLSLGAMVVVSPLLQLPCLAAGAVVWATRKCEKQPAGPIARVLLVSGTYVGVELAVPKALGDTIGQGLLANPLLAQAADLCGVHGLTFLLVAGNMFFASAFVWLQCDSTQSMRRAFVRVAAAGAGIASLAGYGMMRWQAFAPRSAQPPIVAGVVQGNLSHYDRLRAERGTYGAVRMILDRYFDLTRLGRSPEVDFWVWPETVYPTTFGQPKSEAGAEFDAEILKFVEQLDRPLVFGAYDRDDGGEYVAAFFVWPEAGKPRVGGVYRKAAPFPFTERVPGWVDSLGLRLWAPWLGTWRPGGGARVVEIPRPEGRAIRVLPLLCYDALWAEYADFGARHGADLLLVLSNDSWFSEGRGLWLPLVGSAFRSLETRRPQVRVTPTGMTALVSARGEIQILVPPGKSGVARAYLDWPAQEEVTWAVRLRGWPALIVLAGLPLGAGGGLAWFARRMSRRKFALQ